MLVKLDTEGEVTLIDQVSGGGPLVLTTQPLILMASEHKNLKHAWNYLIRRNFGGDKFSHIFGQELDLHEIARKLVRIFFNFAHKKFWGKFLQNLPPIFCFYCLIWGNFNFWRCTKINPKKISHFRAHEMRKFARAKISTNKVRTTLNHIFAQNLSN